MNILNQVGMASTPENNGLFVDRSGSVDATDKLQAWLAGLVKNGDEGYLGPGTFTTSAELLATGGDTLMLKGAGKRRTIIRPSSSSFYALRVFANAKPASFSGSWDGFAVLDRGWWCAQATQLAGRSQGGMWLKSLRAAA